MTSYRPFTQIGDMIKGLVDTTQKVLDEEANKDGIYSAMLEEYGVADPLELSETLQDEFYTIGTEMLGEKYVGFAELKRRISARGGVRNPAGVAAAIGRKKYGKEKFQAMAAAGKKKTLKEIGGDGPTGLAEDDGCEPIIRSAKPREDGKKELVEKKKKVQEAYEHMSDAARELVLHADNDQHLHHSSHEPIMKNLQKKVHKGTYKHDLAAKLWKYHADRAAHSYAKEYGDGTPWHKMFSTADRKQAAQHFADRAKEELHEDDQTRLMDAEKKINEVSNEAPNIQRLTLTQETHAHHEDGGHMDKTTREKPGSTHHNATGDGYVGGSTAMGEESDYQPHHDPKHRGKMFLKDMTVKERTAFHMAAAAAAKAGKSHFTFQGTKYPSTMSKDVAHKMTEEPVETMKQVKMVHQEDVYVPGTKVKVPHKGKMVSGKIIRHDSGDKHGSPFYVVDVGEYESSKVPAHKVHQEEEAKDPMLSNPLQHKGGKPTYKVEEEDESKTDKKIQKIRQDAETERKRLRKSLREPMRKIHQEEEEAKDPMLSNPLQHKGGKPAYKVEEEEERHMTSGEMKKRERIAKALKPISKWEKRYPGRGKEVMYATATKQAMKEDTVKKLAKEIQDKKKVKTEEEMPLKGEGGKTLTGQTPNVIEMNPVHKDGIMSGAQVKSGN